MTMAVHRFGFAMSLLAICLQVVVCMMGGRLCLQAVPTSSERDASCATVCCDDSGVDLTAAVIGTTVEMASPILPSNSQCCLKQSREYFAGNLDGPSTRLSNIVVLPAVRASINLQQDNDTALQQSSTASAALSAQPPPTLLALQTTILRI